MCVDTCTIHTVLILVILFPTSGVYGHEDYHMALPLLLVHLPSGPVIQKGSLYHCLPVELQAVLNQNVSERELLCVSVCECVCLCIVVCETSQYIVVILTMSHV